MNTSAQPQSRHSPDDPWDKLFLAHRKFRNDLDCCREMFNLIAPILKKEDARRHREMERIGVEIESDGKEKKKRLTFEEVQELVSHIAKMETADRMFRQNTIVSIVSKFDEFLMVLLRCGFEENPNWLKNPDKSITYVQLLEIESIDRFVDELIKKEVDSLMRGSHHAQIALLDAKLKIGIQEHFEGWSEFLEITERRNLFVHSGGVVNSIYRENAVALGYPTPTEDELSATDDYVYRAIEIFYELSVRLIQGVSRRLFPKCHTDADWKLNNQSVELLQAEQWKLASKMFRYAIGIPDNLRAVEEIKYYNTINLCIALKFQGEPFDDEIGRVSWKPLHPKYQFAVAVLEDRYEDASSMMKSEAVRQQVDKDSILTWPLLREFRKTDEFKTAFKAIYGYEFEKELLEKTKESIARVDEAELSLEEKIETYPFDYQELNRQLSERYTDFKANQLYHAVRKPLVGDSRYTTKRVVDSADPDGNEYDHYSPKVFHVFDKYYNIKSGKNGE